MCLNFMSWFRGIADHLSWLLIHNMKPTDHGSHHVKGFQDCSMHSWNKWVLEMSTWVESPCTIRKRTARIGCPQTWEFRGFWPVKLKSQILRHCRRPRPLPQSPSVQPDMFIVGAKTEQNKMKKRRREEQDPSFLPSFLFRAGATTWCYLSGHH